jgi:hypothetical protein
MIWRNKTKVGLPAVVLCFTLLGIAVPTESSSPGGLAISSSPQGSAVEFVGPVRMSGVTPFELPGQHGGHFRVTLRKSGFVTRIGWLELSSEGPGASAIARTGVHVPELALTLVGLAGPSKFVRGETQKGIILTVTQAAAVLGALEEEWLVRRYRDKYDDFRSKYLSAQSEEEAAFYHTKLSLNRGLADNARLARDGYLIAACVPSFYALVENVLLDRGTGLVSVGANGVAFRLKPVSMPSAMLRGVLFPGMGHIYSGHKSAGTFWGASVVSAAGAALVAQRYYRDCRLHYSEALREYENASTEEAAERARKKLEDEFETLDSASQTRRVVRGVAIGLWALSVLDAARASAIAPGETGVIPGKSFSLGISGSSDRIYVAVRVPLR